MQNHFLFAFLNLNYEQVKKLNPSCISILKESQKLRRELSYLCFRGKADFMHMLYIHCEILNIFFKSIYRKIREPFLKKNIPKFESREEKRIQVKRYLR